MPPWLRDLAAVAAAGGRLGILTDVDGTISSLAPRPDLARIDPRARSALAALVGVVPLVGVVSGRELDDLCQMVDVPGLFYSAGHGLAWRFGADEGHVRDAEAFAALVGPAKAGLAAWLHGQPVRFERKRFGLAIHYRDAMDHARARAAVLAAVAAVPAARPFAVREGARVVELIPPLPVSKGSVLREVVERFALTALVYFGDDHTDADAFRALRELRGSGRISGTAVAVVHTETAAEALDSADVTVLGVEGVVTALEFLARTLRQSC